MTEYECAWWNYKMVKTSEVTFQFSNVAFTLRHFYFIQNFFPIFAIFLESHNQELHSDSGTIFFGMRCEGHLLEFLSKLKSPSNAVK